MARDFQSIVRPALERLLEPGESLAGIAAATRRKTFSGGVVALGVTDHRLIVQRLTRRHEPDGEAQVVTAEQVASMWSGVAGSEWWNADYPMSGAALTLRLTTDDGTKFVLDFMRGGDGLLGRLGGGQSQDEGVAALAAWMQRVVG